MNKCVRQVADMCTYCLHYEQRIKMVDFVFRCAASERLIQRVAYRSRGIIQGFCGANGPTGLRARATSAINNAAWRYKLPPVLSRVRATAPGAISGAMIYRVKPTLRGFGRARDSVSSQRRAIACVIRVWRIRARYVTSRHAGLMSPFYHPNIVIFYVPPYHNLNLTTVKITLRTARNARFDNFVLFQSLVFFLLLYFLCSLMEVTFWLRQSKKNRNKVRLVRVNRLF